MTVRLYTVETRDKDRYVVDGKAQQEARIEVSNKKQGSALPRSRHEFFERGWRSQIDRVLGFFSSRPNWDPITFGSGGGGAHSPAGEGVGREVPVRTRGQTMWYSSVCRYTFTLWWR
jgi:hypothetical protein